jgi:hypothetical protein
MFVKRLLHTTVVSVSILALFTASNKREKEKIKKNTKGRQVYAR